VETHQVTNQPPPLADVSFYETDRVLVEGLAREGGELGLDTVQSFGAALGSARVIELGFQANRHAPELRSHDRFGHRIDEVRFHPAWHEIMALAMRHEVHNLPWRRPGPGAHVARSALLFLLAQVEAGSCCPLTMTFACVPALRHEPSLFARVEPGLLATEYDPRSLPVAEKRSVLIGMAMTEKQGGSDVRANTTRARPLESGGAGAGYLLTGHKWFCSAPMSDGFLTLAKVSGDAITCFFVPRWLPDGTRNAFRIQRLKDKLGNRSNASSEVEYDETFAWRVGEEGRGIRTILDMVHHTRLDCVSGSAGLMRQALAQATHHAAHRRAFGRLLAEQPLMQQVLADLALESEAATALALRLARAYDEAPGEASAGAFARIATAVAKYWVCKRAPHMIYEAMECLGGNGYVEESVLPRLYREAPVNAIWEGSGNVICLDVLRAMVREPASVPALLDEIRLARGADRRLDTAAARLEAELADPRDAERRARRLVERMALVLQASLLVRSAPPAVADAFCASRLEEGGGGLVFGTLPPAADAAALVARATPVPS